jgi:ABC-2 type transport system ATP-binding protein
MIAAITDLTVDYGHLRALDGVALSLPEGAVGLLGPNGAGKTTLLKTLLGFLRPSRGRVGVLGLDVAADPLAVRARVGYMPESDAFLPDRNAVAMVTLAGELGGLGKSAATSRAHEVLSYVGLGEARYRQVATYSTGMKSRVKLAQALVADPDLLLLDEPTNGLDPDGRREMLALVRDLRRRLGIHVLLSSHLLHDVEEVCEYVVLIDRGRVAVAAPLGELKSLTERRYDVAIRGAEDRFAAALADRGVTLARDRDGLTVTLDGDATEPLLEAAVASGVELRRLVRRERSLAEVFVAAVRSGSGAGAR